MNSIFNKFRKRSISKDGSSFGSNSSLYNSGAMTLSPYTVNEKQLHPFLKAAWRNDLSKVKKLMKKNYNQIDQDKRSGFHLACAAGNLDVIKELLSNYQNEILEKCDINNKTGLYKAVEKGIIQNVIYLLDKGAKTDIKDDKGDSLIHATIRYKHLAVLNYLLQKQVNYTEPNRDGMTPLHLTAELNFVDGMISLLDYPCGIDEKNKSGKTALIIATESGHTNGVKLLLSKDADKTIIDDERYSALYYATYHQHTECMELLQKVEGFDTLKRVPKVPVLPNFLGDTKSDVRHSEHSETSYQIPNNEKVSRTLDSEEKLQERKFTRPESIHSNNTWMGDFASTSSGITIPNSIARNDISTPSSMPNPSEIIKNQPKSYAYNNHFAKQLSDDESQWTDNEKNIPEEYLSPNNKLKDPEKNFQNKIQTDGNKISDSEWDSDDTECNEVELSTIDEESQGKANHINSHRSLPNVLKKDHIDLDSSDMSFLPLPNNADDDHQTDSNIDECFENNYIITNPPIKYDSVDDLSTDSSATDGLNDLYNKQIAHKRNKNKPVAPLSKPPKSPSVSTFDQIIPKIAVEMVSETERIVRYNQAGGDFHSYSSTEHDKTSKNGSLEELNSLKDNKIANLKSLEDYIKKCTQLESKLRSMESEKDILHYNINSIKEQRDKSEMEKSKILKENLKLEGKLSEKLSEIEGFVSKCDNVEEQLKKREREILEMKQMKVNLEGNYRILETDKIDSNSKIKQLEQELEQFKSGKERNHIDEEQIQQERLKYEDELKKSKKINEELTTQITDYLQEIAKKDEYFSKVNMEHEKNIKNLKEKIKKESDEKDSFEEEIDQLKKTIKNLNSDIESSNRSMALVSKQERENNVLKDQILDLENKTSQLLMDNKNLKKTMEDKDQKIHKSDLDIGRLENQISLKDDRISQLEIQYKTIENQIRDLEKLLEKKNTELRNFEEKVIDSETELKTEMKKIENVLEIVNEAIHTAIDEYPESSAILEKLHSVRKLISNSDAESIKSQSHIKSESHNIDLSIELAKSRSQIRVLQEEIDQMKNDCINQISSNKNLQSKYNFSSKHMIKNEDIENEIEVERIDKFEKIEKMNRAELQSNSKIIQNSQIEMEIAQLSNKAAMIEDDRNKLIEEIKTLNEALNKERCIKDNLTEQLLNLVKSSHGSNQQLNGYEPIVQNIAGFTNSLSQFYVPHGMTDNDRKVYANSMLNLSFTKSIGVDENDLRQKLREELDRSIAKHLESGKPIRKLNIKDKIRSLNNGYRPINTVSWKSP